MTDTNIYNDDTSMSRNRKVAEEVKKNPKLKGEELSETKDGAQTREKEDPTRYGAWTKGGREIDF